MVVRARAPLRLGLAGGGSDVSPYCDIYGGYVLNATIDRYAYAVIRLLEAGEVRFNAPDAFQSASFKLSDSFDDSGILMLHKAVYNHMIKHYNAGIPISLEMNTFCDAPPGSGLGSSSTLVVAMIRAFVELLNIPLDDYAIAQLAFTIERVTCGLQGGRQDQYSATFGGFNFMEFYSQDRSIINSLRIKNWIICELEASLLLFFTGISRESAKIIADQSANVNSGSIESIEAMHGIKREAIEMKEALLRGSFGNLAESMQRGWENKKRSSASISNSFIDEVYQDALKSGALAGKVSGAGGGGFMLFLVPTEKRVNLIRALSKYNGEISNCHFTNTGCQAWRVYAQLY